MSYRYQLRNILTPCHCSLALGQLPFVGDLWTMSLRRALPKEKYLSLQRELLRKGELYEDREFPPVFRSIFTKTRPSVNLQWKRPKVCLWSDLTSNKQTNRTSLRCNRQHVYLWEGYKIYGIPKPVLIIQVHRKMTFIYQTILLQWSTSTQSLPLLSSIITLLSQKKVKEYRHECNTRSVTYKYLYVHSL